MDRKLDEDGWERVETAKSQKQAKGEDKAKETASREGDGRQKDEEQRRRRTEEEERRKKLDDTQKAEEGRKKSGEGHGLDDDEHARKEQRRRDELERRKRDDEARLDDLAKEELRRREEVRHHGTDVHRRKQEDRKQEEQKKAEADKKSQEQFRQHEAELRRKHDQRKRDEEESKRQDEERRAADVQRIKDEQKRREEEEQRLKEERKRKDQEERKEDERQKVETEAKLRREQQATLTMLATLSKCSKATTEDYDRLRAAVELAMERDLPSTGQQQDVLKAEAGRVLQHSAAYVERQRGLQLTWREWRVAEQQRASAQEVAARQKSADQEAQVRALLEDYGQLVSKVEAAVRELQETAAPLAGPLLPDEELLQISQATEKAGQEALTLCSRCADFITGHAPTLRAAEGLHQVVNEQLRLLSPRMQDASRVVAQVMSGTRAKRERAARARATGTACPKASSPLPVIDLGKPVPQVPSLGKDKDGIEWVWHTAAWPSGDADTPAS